MYTNITFDCECGSVVREGVYYPVHIADTEKEREQFQETESEVECDSCGRPYHVLIKNNAYDTECVVNHGEVRVEITEPQHEEHELELLIPEESNRIKLFRQQLKYVMLLVNSEVDPEAQYAHHVMLYSHLIASAEGYLFSTFNHYVTKSDTLLRRLVESDPEVAKMRFDLSEIFVRQETLKETIAKHLNSVIFHNLKSTTKMYASVFGFGFGDISWFYRAVSNRHHCAHRGGYDKAGNPLNINKGTIIELTTKLSDLIESIEIRVADFDDDGFRLKPSGKAAKQSV